MKTFTEEEFAWGVIGLTVVALVIGIAAATKGFSDAETEIGEGIGLGALFTIVAVTLVLL